MAGCADSSYEVALHVASLPAFSHTFTPDATLKRYGLSRVHVGQPLDEFQKHPMHLANSKGQKLLPSEFARSKADHKNRVRPEENIEFLFASLERGKFD